MNRLCRMVAAAGLALSAASLSLAFAPPTADQITQATKKYQELRAKATEQARKDKKPIQMTDSASWANEALKDLDLSEATPAQIAQLMQGAGLGESEKAGAARERLASLAKANSAEGGEAALVLMSMAARERDADKQADAFNAALTHAGLKDALAAGRGLRELSAISALSKDARPKVLPAIYGLADRLPDDLPAAAAQSLARVFQGLAEMPGDEARQQREPLRGKLVAALKAARAKVTGTDDAALASAKRLDGTIKMLDGPLGRGTLVGGPAPEINFAWSSFDQPVSKLSDLKGKVVVLDFWATWCGPCVASFPKVKELAARYKDYPVVIVGVTSLQGRHYPKLGAEPIDTKGNPQKEYDLMKTYIAETGLTWPIAFSEQEVFNPEYGVNGIPHVVIIDPNGNVRFRNLHPANPLKQKADHIDSILKEFKLPAPPAVEG
ncbi:MAG: TlpA family protein disulfide reductase [Phycisphaeraceae bacterium]|nr:TlpA family protein disulfide reductase [Phycisphaeraceae bacterium]